MILNIASYLSNPNADDLIEEMIAWCEKMIGPKLKVKKDSTMVGQGWQLGLKRRPNLKSAAIFLFTFDDEGDAIQFKLMWPLCTKEK